MTEENSTPENTPEESQSEAPAAAQPEPQATPPAPSADIEEGKTFAILSYALSFIGLPFFIVPLIMRNNDFSLYHGKQCSMIWIGGVAVSLVGSLLAALCIGFIILPAGMIFLLVLNIIGLMNAVKGEQKAVPVIGKWGEEWFKGLKKA